MFAQTLQQSRGFGNFRLDFTEAAAVAAWALRKNKVRVWLPSFHSSPRRFPAAGRASSSGSGGQDQYRDGGNDDLYQWYRIISGNTYFLFFFCCVWLLWRKGGGRGKGLEWAKYKRKQLIKCMSLVNTLSRIWNAKIRCIKKKIMKSVFSNAICLHYKNCERCLHACMHVFKMFKKIIKHIRSLYFVCTSFFKSDKLH